tara:strand:- start:1672 stop:2289 length:618 start_codon:yes stop_codon:yes gene_type:complete
VHFLSKKISFIFLFLEINIYLFGSDVQWIKVKLEKGVTVYRAKIDTRTSFRGVGNLKGKPKDLISIIENPAGWKNWIENLKSGKLIENKNHNHKIFYQAIKSPFPISDRDVVYESKIFREAPNQVRIEMKSVTHPKAPKSIGVRMNIIFTRYIIETMKEGTMRVTFETLSESGGALPDFLVNWASESYPITLFEGLRRELNKIKK